MSLKDAFKKKTSILQNAATSSAGIESSDYLITKIQVEDRFEPHINFASSSAFAHFGSAEIYYDSAIKRIHNEYPYDGTKREKLLFDLSSSYLDKWVFDNKYPKTTGYINFSHGGWGTADSITNGYGLPANSADYEYIFVKGGIHTRTGLPDSKLTTIFQNSPIVYDSAKKRVKTFVLDMAEGISVEFWLKKDSFDLTKTKKEVILDLWNGELSSSANYGRFTLELSGTANAEEGQDTFRVTLYSGSTGFFSQPIGTSVITTGSLSNWAHYAFTAVSGDSGITSRLYKNGVLDENKTLGSSGIGEIGGLINGYIGALITSPSSSNGAATAAKYAGKLNASLDEFRFWKTRRTSEQIHANWISHVGGGTNDEDHNIDLCLYYKFNEGITTETSNDSIVLDYSGRIANGAWTGYSSGARNTGSAFLSSSFAIPEELDPIIYSSHSKVQALKSEMAISGSEWDEVNTSYLYRTNIPDWILEEDESDQVVSNLKKFYQIISSYFDTAYSQIWAMPKLKEKNYTFSKYKQLPFARELLENRGFVTSDLFVNSDILERFSKRTLDNTLFEKDLEEIKNAIYTNIYNNLEYIQKSKGTEKSIRNLLRCFGVDDEVVKLNIYSNNSVHYFQNNNKLTSVKRKFLDFHSSENAGATVFQTSSINTSYSYITGSRAEKKEQHSAFTAEVNIRVPIKLDPLNGGYNFGGLYSSIYGMREANETEYDWRAFGDDTANFEVFLRRDKSDSKTAKFGIRTRDRTIDLTSSFYPDIYDDSFWTLAVRVKPDQYPYSRAVNIAPTYKLEFYGVQHSFDVIQNEFTLTASLSHISGAAFLSNSKRFWLGAKRHNDFSAAAVAMKSDIQVSDFRFYLDYLDDETIKNHNLDSMNYGTDSPSFSISPAINELSGGALPAWDSLALHWSFGNLTSSDSGGNFVFQDLSSGSSPTKYGWVDGIVNTSHDGYGYGFPANSSGIVINDYLVDSKKELPEISYTSDSVVVRDDERKFFFDNKESKGSYFSLEKSLGQVISGEMLNLFASVKDFSTLIGKPVDRYRMNYKNLDIARQFFFERVSGSIDFENFIEYYKWIDSSISQMIKQLYPASVQTSDSIIDVVESHILERNKYQNKFPLLTTYTATENSLKGRKELNYNWKYGHAPIGKTENDNCLWQKERAERSDIVDRETIRKSIINDNNVTSSVLGNLDGSSYRSNLYHDRRLAQPLVLTKKIVKTIHGGINYPENKDRDFIHNAVHRHGPKTSIGVPKNTLLVGIGPGQGVTEQQRCDDVNDPNILKKIHVKATVGRFAGSGVLPSASSDAESYIFRTDESKIPLNIISASVSTGYAAKVSASFKGDAIITNIHSDTTDFTNEIPMQGPFPLQWVGGHQSRHISVNRYDASLRDDYLGGSPPNSIDNQYTRPEAWRLLLGDKYSSDGAFGFAGFDYGGPYPDPARKGATYYRGLRAKRPLNIANIKTTTGSNEHGNFYENYELISAVGKHQNNFYFRRNPDIGNYLPASIISTLPKTTHVMGLYGQAPFVSGNVFGTHHNNRQPDISNIVLTSGSYATASFTVLKAPSRAKATGSFDVKGIIQEPFLDGTKFYVHSTATGTKNFIIKTGSAPSDSNPNYYVETGSSNTDFWNNLRTSLTNNSGYAASYVSSGFVGGQRNSVALECSSSGNAKFALSSNGVTDFVQSHFSFSSWIYLSSSFAGLDKYIFRFNSGSANSRELFVSGNGDLYYNARFANGGVTYCDQSWRLTNFESNHSGSWVHLVVTHQLPVQSFGTVRFYVNTTLTSSVNSSTPSSAGACTAGVNTALYDSDGVIYFLNRDVDPSSNTEFRGSIDEISIWDAQLSTDQINNLYNGGRRAIITNNYLSSSDLMAWYSFEDRLENVYGQVPSGKEINDYSGRGNHLTTINPSNQFIIATTGSTILNEEYATFMLTASAYGDGYNGSLALNASYTSNQNIVMKIPGATQAPAGGFISGALNGAQIGISNHGFEVDADGDGTEGGEAYGVPWGGGKLHQIAIAYGGSNTSFWNTLSQSIKDNTDFGTINISTSTESANFYLTASSQSDSNNGNMVRHSGGSYHTFTNLLGPSGGVTHDDRLANDIVIGVPDGLINGSKNRTIITSRFSAPGGIEIQSKGYLDVYSHEYSVHNALPYRNLTVRGSGSGESTTIRLLDHLGKRHGLNTHLTRHSGKFGTDSVYGVADITNAEGYTTNPAFHKIQRNISRKPTAASTLLAPVFNEDHDNGFIQRPIPQSEFQYSWITASLGGNYSVGSGKQRIYGYAPRSGEVSASYYGIVEAIVFPSASEIYGE